MAAIYQVSGKIEALETVIATLKAKGEKYFNFQVSHFDEKNEYDQDVAMTISQSKEDREAGKKKFYVGNGKKVWGSAPKKKLALGQHPSELGGPDELPF